MSRYAKSVQHYEEARQIIPGGVNSNVRLASQPVPLFYERAQGAHLTDVDGNDYIDYALGMGPVVLGHAPPRVTQAVAETLSLGQLFGGQNPYEVPVARRMIECIPCAEQVRFASSGSEAVHAAVRLARSHTGRKTIVKFEGHYHGWLDTIYTAHHHWPSTTDTHGVPVAEPETPGQPEGALADIRVLPWNDLDALREVVTKEGDGIAAILMEAIMCNTGVIPPQPGYLEGVRELCDQHGIVLIFDEVITGFRVGLQGAQGLLGVTPDLAVYAKAMAAGFPLSAVAGRKAIMQHAGSGTLLAGTYNASVPVMTAAQAALEVLSEDGGAPYRTMTARGERLMAGLRERAAKHGLPMLVQGFGSVFSTAFSEAQAHHHARDVAQADAKRMDAFSTALQDNGVRVTSRGTWFLSTAHTDADVEQTLEAADAALATVKAQN